MILNIQRQSDPTFPLRVTLLSNGRAKTVGIRDVAHLKRRLFELNPYLVMDDYEFAVMVENWADVIDLSNLPNP